MSNPLFKPTVPLGCVDTGTSYGIQPTTDLRVPTFPQYEPVNVMTEIGLQPRADIDTVMKNNIDTYLRSK